jgi:hypothetical protein
MHPDPVRYHFIGISFMGKEQCLCPFAFLGPLFSPVHDVMKQFFFILRQRYFVFLL